MKSPQDGPETGIASVIVLCERVVFSLFNALFFTRFGGFNAYPRVFRGSIKYRIPAYPYMDYYEQGEDQGSRQRI